MPHPHLDPGRLRVQAGAARTRTSCRPRRFLRRRAGVPAPLPGVPRRARPHVGRAYHSHSTRPRARRGGASRKGLHRLAPRRSSTAFACRDRARHRPTRSRCLDPPRSNRGGSPTRVGRQLRESYAPSLRWGAEGVPRRSRPKAHRPALPLPDGPRPDPSARRPRPPSPQGGRAR